MTSYSLIDVTLACGLWKTATRMSKGSQTHQRIFRLRPFSSRHIRICHYAR
ncbi:hypothetical protein K443DRAFT_539064 [Laccaria amethystina LaAM-08-1]|uniref:Uncharacterized protein n=1 Tax=Laccaria amethystina LaAM-08-1 TaxID=1095629 RepID=A0A0C9XKZ4_9AGAR|nr:hypothetical protein K443DRAFT_539064 [Laccaria amethystina LaAM-08-1]